MPSCPTSVIAAGQYTNFFAGPYSSTDVGSITSWSFLDGRCTEHTVGYPYKSKKTSIVGVSLVVFDKVNSGVGGLGTYKGGQVLLMVTDGIIT